MALNDAESKWVAALLDLCREVMKSADVSPAGSITLEALDAAFAAWLDEPMGSSEEVNRLINAFGIGFGQHLVNEVGMRWAVVQDERGTEMAVVADGEGGPIIVFPPNFVAKRFQSRVTGFFVPFGNDIKEKVRSLVAKKPSANSIKTPKSRWWNLWVKKTN